MANASADKFKALALHHGEKAVMAVAVSLSCSCSSWPRAKKRSRRPPNRSGKAAEAANSDLRNHQNPDDILKKLEDNGIKEPDFQKRVDDQSKNQLVADNYKVRSPWVTSSRGRG